MAPWVVGATLREIVFTGVYGIYLKDLLKNQQAQRAQIYIKVFGHSASASF
jgi:hypothetical protein